MVSMLPKFELVPMRNILHDVRIGTPPFLNAGSEDAQVRVEQDHVGGFTRDIVSAIDGEPDIRSPYRRGNVDFRLP